MVIANFNIMNGSKYRHPKTNLIIKKEDTGESYSKMLAQSWDAAMHNNIEGPFIN